MRVGVPAETKNNEGRIALTPAGAHALVERGHEVRVLAGAGVASGFSDDEYREAGAIIVDTAEEAWAQELVLKVKEPTPAEYGFLTDNILFTYLHLAADKPLTEALMAAGTTAVAYETVQLPDRSLPLLNPMSEIAGRLSAQEGATHLKATNGGRGILMGGVPGTERANVVVIGGGVAGEHAAATALGMGADVTIMDVSLPRLRQLDSLYGRRIKTLASNSYALAEQVAKADLVIGSVLIPGAAAPKLVTDAMIKTARPGAVFVDIAIDQGGCFEGSKATTHADPTFKLHDAVMYCVANMPGAVPATATAALTNTTLPYVLKVADKGWEAAADADAALALGLNVAGGQVVNEPVKVALGL
ncbi:alanine dehydrogenase [Agrococcus casei]|uniref:Alanine dehydrogenase n=1 Tax=Agrococcus casei LMG 22410 TaxID=1255656 RepID=A0A1R4G945_9MICO|nr:alanine dehydrogenase [Agrococcus casei]SJM64593.1 Alanine dehydrogenase [Agrococcus casei LMG 22410]